MTFQPFNLVPSHDYKVKHNKVLSSHLTRLRKYTPINLRKGTMPPDAWKHFVSVFHDINKMRRSDSHLYMRKYDFLITVYSTVCSLEENTNFSKTMTRSEK